MGDGGVTSVLDLIKGGDQLIPVGWLLQIKFFKNCLVGPDPVGGMDIDRGGNPVTVML